MPAPTRVLRALNWLILLLVALVVPVYALGVEWRHSENCAPDLSAADLAQARQIALVTWGASLVAVGGALWLALWLLTETNAVLWVVFGCWKSVALALAFVTSPSCFESYGYLQDRMSQLEAWLGVATLLGWLALLIAIILRAVLGLGAVRSRR